MILSNDGLVAFHYRSYGTFFLHQNKLHNIHRGFTHYKYYRASFFNKIIHLKFVWLSFPYEILLKYFFNLLFVKKITNI